MDPPNTHPIPTKGAAKASKALGNFDDILKRLGKTVDDDTAHIIEPKTAPAGKYSEFNNEKEWYTGTYLGNSLAHSQPEPLLHTRTHSLASTHT